MHSDNEIRENFRVTRREQSIMAERNKVREICWDCKAIAEKLGTSY
jgi:hypothetical protein